MLQVFELDGGELHVAAQAEQPASLKCGAFGAGAGAAHLALGDFAGQLQLLDLDQPGSGPLFSIQAHRGIVNALDACGDRVGAGHLGQGRRQHVILRLLLRLRRQPPTCKFANTQDELARLQDGGCGPPAIATAGADGGVRVWDPRAPAAPTAAFLPAEGAAQRDCWCGCHCSGSTPRNLLTIAGWCSAFVKLDMGLHQMRVSLPSACCRCVAFGDAHDGEGQCLLAGYDNGDVKMFDLRGGGAAVRWQTNVAKGVCSVQVGGDRATRRCLGAAGAPAMHACLGGLLGSTERGASPP